MKPLNTTKKKLLILTTTLPRWEGDSEAPFVLNQAKELSKYYEVHVLAPYHPGSKKEEVIDEVFIHRFRYWSKENLAYGAGILNNFKKGFSNKVQAPLLVLSMLLKTRGLIRKHKISFVNAWFSIPAGYIASLFSIPYILTVPGSDINSQGFQSFKVRAYSKASKIVVLSNALQDQVKNAGFDSEVIPIGVNEELFSFKEGRDSNEILFVGRLNEQKGCQWLIKALPLIRKEKDVILNIVGEGDYEHELKKLVREEEVEKFVNFLGPKGNNELQEYYQKSSVFVMPSQNYEGLGLVLAEAMLCGTPVVGANVGGIPSLIIDGVTGVLAKQKSPESIAEAVLKQLSPNPEMVKDAHDHIKNNYTWPSIGTKHKEVFDEI